MARKRKEISPERRLDEPSRTWERVSAVYWVPVFFAVAAMAALALGPTYLDSAVEEEQLRLTRDLEPTRTRISQLQLENSRRSQAYTAWLLREAPRYRQAYLAAQARASDQLEQLAAMTETIDPELRVQVAELFNANFEWSNNHAEVVAAEVIDSVARARFYQTYDRDRDLYERVLAEQEELLESVGEFVQRAQEDVEAARRRRQGWSVVLIVVALLASFAVALVGFGLRRALRDSHQRRRDAVWARRRTAGVLRATADGVIGLDLDGRATFVNPSGARILGRAASEIEGRPIHEVVHGSGSDHEAGQCPWIPDAEEAGPSDPVDDWFARSDGTEFPVQASALPMIDGVERRGAVMTFSDMTDIRRAEEALREAVRAREEVVSVVSHDLRNPVGTIFAAADLIRDADLDGDEVQNQATVIQRGARRMDRLIRDLLDVTRIEQGGFPVYLRPMAPSLLVREAEELLRPLVERNGIRFEVGVPAGLPRVSADSDRLLQVFSNLVGNAVKFTPPGGRIAVVAAEGRNGDVVFQVSDTGKGIDPRDQEHLFERYWRVGSGQSQGTGLGLAIVEGIVQAHGGEVWVESTPGEGARFLFALNTAEKGPVHAGRRPAGVGGVASGVGADGDTGTGGGVGTAGAGSVDGEGEDPPESPESGGPGKAPAAAYGRVAGTRVSRRPSDPRPN